MPLDTMRRILFILSLTCSWAALATFAQTIAVSPDGPVRTLGQARDAARTLRASGQSGTITIQINDGVYFLPETLVLTPEDSNTVWEAAPGSRPVISGGRVLSGWKRGTGNVWTAPAGGLQFRQLFVSGRRAQRARTPNFGFYRIDGPSPTDKPIQLHYRGNDIKKHWADAGDVEVIGLLAWADFRMPVVSVDEAARVATLTLDPRPSNKETDARYYIENASDALDTAGEWYLDRKSDTVSYRPVTGENMESEQVIVPALVQLVRLEGKPEAGQFVRNVKFRGLKFAHADWTMTDKGYADTQAAMHAPSAIEGVGAVDCTIEKCTVAHSGGYAIYFGRGSKRNQVLASELFDLGAGGVKLGEPRQFANEAEQNFENVVADNHLHDLGLVYPPAVGVWVLQSGRNQIIHNHIHDLYYTAISVGWTWGYGANQSKANIIEYNHLHDIGKEMLSDMGGIYTLGMQPGTRIRNNLIHSVASFTYGGWGIYPDEGSSEMLIENNIVYNCKSAGFHQHYGRDNIVRNNIWAFNRENQLMRTRMEPHVSFRFEGNIVYFGQGRLLGSNWSDDKYVMKGNIYFDTRSADVRFAGKSFREWATGERDEGSIITDPLFVNPSTFDFRLRPESPALKMGFQQIDMSKVGPRVAAGQ
ncbi:MAG: right-handed parallel beta-helix repeat-containing protein [Bryobacterales bacterium]|nr:right-handed parallel beta-helix repeat-containing protein [Bryobacterales bacterium]